MIRGASTPRTSVGLAVACVIASGCGSPADRPAAPSRAAPAPGVHDVYVIPRRADDGVDRIVRLDASLGASGSIDVAGWNACGGLAAGGGAALVEVPIASDGDERRPSLVLVDADSLEFHALCGVDRDVAYTSYKARPREPFYVGDAAPDVVVVPLRKVRPTGRTTFDVTLRVVDVAKRTWTDVPGPADAGRSALFAAADGAAHAAIVAGRHELVDVDLARGTLRRVTKTPFLAAGRTPGETPLALTGFVVRADEKWALAVNYDGDAVRISLANGAIKPVRLPIDGLGKTAFVIHLVWSAASKRFAATVLRPGDPENCPSHVVFLDADLRATGVGISLASGAEQTIFSPDGGELVVALHDGSVQRRRVADGTLLAASPRGIDVEAVLGVR